MHAITICSDFGAQKNKVSHCFHCCPIYMPWSDGTRCHDLSFWMLSFKPTFLLSSFTFIKRLLISSPSSIRVVICISEVIDISPGNLDSSLCFASGGQSIGASASESVLPMNIQDWSPLGWTGWISLLFQGLSRVFFSTTVQKHPPTGQNVKDWSQSLYGQVKYLQKCARQRQISMKLTEFKHQAPFNAGTFL